MGSGLLCVAAMPCYITSLVIQNAEQIVTLHKFSILNSDQNITQHKNAFQ